MVYFFGVLPYWAEGGWSQRQNVVALNHAQASVPVDIPSQQPESADWSPKGMVTLAAPNQQL